MNMSIALPSMAPAPPIPPDLWKEQEQIHFQIPGQLDHIHDSMGRRLFEGWASVEGLDYGIEDVPAQSLEHAIAAYVKKNNLFVWDHARHMPIGRILDYSIHPGVGVYVKGEIFRPADILGTGDANNPTPQIELPEKSLAWLTQIAKEQTWADMEKALNLIWGLMVQGHVRGISWQGYTLKQWAWSPELQDYVKKHALTINITDFCITPIQVGQGAQITRINKQAKALPLKDALWVAKALPLRKTGDKDMSDKLTKVVQGFDSLLAQLHELPEDVQLDPETAKRMEQTSKALGLLASNGVAEPSSKALELEQKLAALQQELAVVKGEVAPARNRVSHQPANGPAPRPGQTTNVFEMAQKALEIGSTVRDGRTNFGHGEFVGIDETELNVDMVKLHGILTQSYCWEHTQLGDMGRKLLQLAQQNHDVSLHGVIRQQAMA